MEDRKVVGTIDLTPTWRQTASMIVLLIEEGGPKARRQALEELNRMADLADRYVAEHKKDLAST